MASKNNQDELNPSNQERKETYKLWWEYLKRNELYKDFCAIPDPIEQRELITRKYNQKGVIRCYSINKVFGNVHSTSFEKWWETNNINLFTLDLVKPFTPIRKLSSSIGDILNMAHYETQKVLGREPTIEEYKVKVADIIKFHDIGYEKIYLEIITFGKTKAELVELFDKHIKEVKNKPLTRHMESRFFAKPTTRIRADELSRYLKVYDLKKQGLTMKEIIQTIDPNNNGDDANVLRAYNRDHSKAKKIIKNVERNLFPGDY